MSGEARSLMTVFSGWDGYQRSLVSAIAPLSPEQLAWRGAPNQRSVGEIAAHISQGRIGWFHRVLGEGSPEFARQVAALGPEDLKAQAMSAPELVRWLVATWQMVEDALTRWTTADLDRTVLHPYQGKTYALPRQWVIWRIVAHDIHHGGELSFALGLQGISIPELGDLGGHLIEPPEAEAAPPQ